MSFLDHSTVPKSSPRRKEVASSGNRRVVLWSVGGYLYELEFERFCWHTGPDHSRDSYEDRLKREQLSS